MTLNRINRKPVNKIVGVWLTEDAEDACSCQNNVSENSKKEYGQVAMLTKLKYAGACTEDPIEIYCVRSSKDYCTVAFCYSLTQKQSNKIENIQKTSFKIIFGIILLTTRQTVK